MDKTGEEILEKTDLRTLWSETLLEMLQEAIDNQWSANALREITGELRRKGYTRSKLIRMVKKKFGSEVAQQFASRAGLTGNTDTPVKRGQ